MLKLDHTVFPVRDAVATMRFYREILGLPLVGAHEGPDWGGYPWLMLSFGLSGGDHLVCVALKGAPEPDYKTLPADARHYAMAAGSAEEFEAWRSKVTAAVPGAWEEDHGDQRSVYFPDPDGVILEVTWPPSDGPAGEDPAAVRTVERWAAA